VPDVGGIAPHVLSAWSSVGIEQGFSVGNRILECHVQILDFSLISRLPNFMQTGYPRFLLL
jgi:hypothetical protein